MRSLILTLKALLIMGGLFFAVETFVYSMQPPPPPLNIIELKKLILKADLIVVGKTTTIDETISEKEALDKTILITINVEKYLTYSRCGQTVRVLETVPISGAQETLSLTGNNARTSRQILSVSKAGPSSYHGRYHPDERIILFLKKIDENCQFTPLGSGTYDKHFGEFFITDNRITAINYSFAADLKPYTKSETAFTKLIESFVVLTPMSEK